MVEDGDDKDGEIEEEVVPLSGSEGGWWDILLWLAEVGPEEWRGREEEEEDEVSD